MKIISLSVASFGKLNNVNLSFKDGINVISNANGFGKTTMAAFIRAMLYGFTYVRTKNGVDASRYAPWGSDAKFGGSMTVERNGETYRIERYFGKTARSEQLTVVNAQTNKRLDISTSLGEYFLGLTADSYDRSAYFPQEAVELSANDNFEAKLANLVQNSEVDYDKVQKSLRDYRRTLKLEKGNGGKIYDLMTKQRQCQQELRNAQNAERRAVDIDERLKQIADERKQLTAQQSDCKKRLEGLNKTSARQSLSELDRDKLSKLSALESKIARVPNEIDSDKQMLDDLANKASQLKDDVKPRVYPNFAVLAAAVAFIAVGLVLCFAVLPQKWGIIVGLILAAVGIAGVAIAFVRKGAKTLPSGEKDALISDYFKIASKYIVSAYELNYNDLVRAFRKFYSDYLGDKREMEALRSALRSSDAANDETDNHKRQLELVAEKIVDKLTALASEEGRLTQERKSLVYDAVTIQEQIQRLDEQIAEAEYKYRVAMTVSDLLAQSKDNLSTGYLPQLCARCQALLNGVTQGSYEVVIDRAFNVQIRQNGQTKPMSEFSRGIREITLLCFRVALSELLYDNAIPFVIIDDAFVNFDEDNFVRATNLLKHIATRGQVIYFTCHKRTGNLLK